LTSGDLIIELVCIYNTYHS